ncbi:MAG: M48 family metallopeptidase [Spirochaetaceae bacterium]|jgi:predicted Zn-dependent protease|nr:M48 family metallopeptidase [Spirochaetaceae bacterium]
MKKFAGSFFIILLIFACTSNPYTGKKTMALVNNDSLLASSFSQYSQFLQESTVITGTADAAMVERVGNRIRQAAETWAAAMGQSTYLEKYQWEYHLVKSDEVNAWCLPGGKIVVYTGILPVTRDEESLAVVLGHEVAHALLNHGQQRASAGVLQQAGALGVGILTSNQSKGAQDLAQAAFGTGSTLLGTLPFSRSHESEADHIGLILMTIAGYKPEVSVNFWERMAALGGQSSPQFLSTHPSNKTRISDLQRWIPDAWEKAGEIGVIN